MLWLSPSGIICDLISQPGFNARCFSVNSPGVRQKKSFSVRQNKTIQRRIKIVKSEKVTIWHVKRELISQNQRQRAKPGRPNHWPLD